MRQRLLPSVLLFATLSACSTAPPPPAIDENALFTQTIVWWDADGHEQLATKQVTRRQQLDEIAAREADGSGVLRQAIIAAEASCASSDLWMYDQANRSGNQICLTGTGPLHETFLNNFTRPGGTWKYNVRSFWAGEMSGYFSSIVLPGPQWQNEHFYAYQLANTPDSTVTASIAISLGYDYDLAP